MELPEFLHDLFWDVEIDEIDIQEHRSFVISRIMVEGRIPQIRWLIANFDDEEISRALLLTRGEGLNEKQIHMWGVLLNLPRKTVDELVKRVLHEPWR